MHTNIIVWILTDPAQTNLNPLSTKAPSKVRKAVASFVAFKKMEDDNGYLDANLSLTWENYQFRLTLRDFQLQVTLDPRRPWQEELVWSAFMKNCKPSIVSKTIYCSFSPPRRWKCPWEFLRVTKKTVL